MGSVRTEVLKLEAEARSEGKGEGRSVQEARDRVLGGFLND